MVIHLTKKLAEKLKQSPIAEPIQDELFSWRANYIQEHGYRFVVFMNDLSRFTVVINNAKSAKLKKLQEEFIQMLREVLLSLCVNPEVIDRYIEELGEITYSRNSDRKRTVQLNKNTEMVWAVMRSYVDDIELSSFANRVIYNTSGTDEPIIPKQKMLEELRRYELPIRKCRAFDLNVRLDLEGRDAIRRLRVPAEMTFKRFHLLLQKAFEWRNNHLYSFGVFDNRNDNSCISPEVELIASVEDSEMNPDATSVAGMRLSDFVPKYRQILYTYDYGVSWLHYIEVENIIDDCEEELPLLLSGEGDAPPEDIGGIGGFAEFMEIIADPKHEEHEYLKTWANSQWWQTFDFEIVARRILYGW